jgi:hypothetical protein
MTTFNWTITKLYTHPTQNNLTQVVYAVAWKCNGVDEKYTPSFSAFTEGDESVLPADENSFTPYNQLTENQIWEWINEKIDREEIETNLQIRIDGLAAERDKQNMLNTQLPWSE